MSIGKDILLSLFDILEMRRKNNPLASNNWIFLHSHTGNHQLLSEYPTFLLVTGHLLGDRLVYCTCTSCIHGLYKV